MPVSEKPRNPISEPLMAQIRAAISSRRFQVDANRKTVAELEGYIAEDETFIAGLERDIAALEAGYAVLAEREAK